VADAVQTELIEMSVFRVTTHLENLEKSGNSKVVRENGKSQGKVREVKSGVFFQALNTPKLVFSAGGPGLCPGPRWGELTTLPQTP